MRFLKYPIYMVVDVDRLRRLVEEARRTVWEQKGRIVRLRAAGRETWDAQRILLLLETNLQNLQEHKQRLECDGLIAAQLKMPPRAAENGAA
jgi:hypothetical protein